MRTAQTEAEADIDAAITEAVEKTIEDPDVQRLVTQYLIGAHKDLPPEERTAFIIEAILKTLGEENR